MDHKIRTNLIKAYDRYAQDRDKRDIHTWKIQEWDRFLALLKERQKKTLLEIGAGTGKLSESFKDSGLRVVSTDISFEMVKLCQKKGLSAFVMDFCSMAFPKESFDAIWALNCLLHVPKKELPEVLKGIQDVLRPAGLFYMGVYGGSESEGVWENDYYTPNRFFSSYLDGQIQEVVADFFEILYFKAIAIEQGHFQSMILERKPRKNTEKVLWEFV
jgi:SAM-dependent methyltransferase